LSNKSTSNFSNVFYIPSDKCTVSGFPVKVVFKEHQNDCETSPHLQPFLNSPEMLLHDISKANETNIALNANGTEAMLCTHDMLT